MKPNQPLKTAVRIGALVWIPFAVVLAIMAVTEADLFDVHWDCTAVAHDPDAQYVADHPAYFSSVCLVVDRETNFVVRTARTQPHMPWAPGATYEPDFKCLVSKTREIVSCGPSTTTNFYLGIAAVCLECALVVAAYLV